MYLASLAAFVYLVMNGHPKIAGLALSASVLTVIKRQPRLAVGFGILFLRRS
jgi:hypothetical protein